LNYLHIISTLDPRIGGPAEGVRQLTNAATQLGHHVEIASLDAPGAQWLTDMPVQVHALGPGSFGKDHYAPRLYQWLRINAGRFTAVIVNGLWQYHGYAAWRALHRSSTPYFVFTHGMLDPWFRHRYPLKHMKKWLYWPWAEYRVLRDARAVLFTCDEERLRARDSFGLYNVNELVVSYGTPGPTGDAATKRESFLRSFPELRDKRLLLYLGRINPKKGCDLLIEAFAAITHIDASLHLVMAGPDDVGLQAVLARRAAQLGLNNITWTGMLQGDLKWGALHAAEAFVLPSHQENFGIAVAESLACHTPVLISNRWRWAGRGRLAGRHASVAAVMARP
jgi:glycosyltransferase involved in cell wall biosynthesis